MRVKLVKKITILLLLCFCVEVAIGQECETFDFKPSDRERTIAWENFSGIELPFTLVYGGPTLERSKKIPLEYGFTHLSDPSVFSQISPRQRAEIYYGTAYVNQDQPWEILRSPWLNNLQLYENKWSKDYKTFARGEDRIRADLMVFDIERQWRTNFDILQLKNEPRLSSFYQNLDDETFLATYKSDLRDLYSKALLSFKENGGYASFTRVSSYSDAPIWNVFDNIQGVSWSQWQTDKKLVNYLLQDDAQEVGGTFERELDFMTPSAYYYYDYPHPFAGEYLSYLLFQIESNTAWTSKPVIPFVWMRYSFTPAFQNQFIKPWMAEATAIFPFFSGAKGLWLWENPFNFDENENFSTYEHFLKGLKRLSAYKEMFEGDYELVISTSARDYNESKEPIWRGVVNNNQLLIAAHNPHATNENEEAVINVAYGNFQRNITVKGYEIFLCKYDLNLLSSENTEAHVSVFPNPTDDFVFIRFEKPIPSEVKASIRSQKGELLFETSFVKGQFFRIPIKKIPAQALILTLRGEAFFDSKKIIKLP